MVAKDGGARMISEGDFWHAARGPDGKFLVLDDSRGRLWLMETRPATSGCWLLAFVTRSMRPRPRFLRPGSALCAISHRPHA